MKRFSSVVKQTRDPNPASRIKIGTRSELKLLFRSDRDGKEVEIEKLVGIGIQLRPEWFQIVYLKIPTGDNQGIGNEKIRLWIAIRDPHRKILSLHN